jgi:serine phosphatase RsbU (regulator of sigma subunit)
VPLGVGQSVLIGRSPQADLRVPDRGVSSRHALVRVTDAGTFVIDLGSQNGTYVNQRRVETPVRLQNGDVLRLGDAVIEFRGGQPAVVVPATALMPAGDARPGDTQVLLAIAAVPATPATATPAASRHAGLLDRLQQLLSRSLDTATLLPAVADHLLAALPRAERVFIFRGDTSETLGVASACVRSGPATVAPSRTLLRRVAERREGLLYSDVRTEGPVGDADSVRLASMRAVMCAPMAFDNRLFGVVQVDTTVSVAAFTDADLKTLMAVATQLAATLAYATLHEERLAAGLLAHDLELARRIQRQFLPERLPDLTQFGFDVLFEPAQAVGGDFYDVLPLDRGQFAFALGDVSGKGVAAAIYAASVLADLRSLVPLAADPALALRALNDRLSARDREGMFVTLLLGTLVPATGELTLASAGHPLPVARNAAGHVTTLGHVGAPPIGIDPEARFDAHRYELDRGDTVVAYTDGIPEAANADGELFGAARLLTAIAAADGTAHGACAALLADARTFLGGRPFGDDVTILSFTRN